MNDRTIQLLEQLYPDYYFHPECKKDILTLLRDNGSDKVFVNLFAKNTDVLREFGIEVIKHRNFEKLKQASNLYSMKLKLPSQNLRIIYAYKSGRLALLLCSFHEKSDSKDKYSKYIPIAYRRLREIEEEQWKGI